MSAFWDGLMSVEESRALWQASVAQHWHAPVGPPRVASLLLTYRCSLSCRYCPLYHRPGRVAAREAPTDAWMAALEMLAAAGVRRVSFSGGEPTLHPGLPALVRHAKRQGLTATLVTNGGALIDAPDVLSAGLDAITISLDSVDPAMLRALGRGSEAHLRRVEEALARLLERRTAWVGINVVLSRNNLLGLGRLIEFCARRRLPMQVQACNAFPGGEDLRPSEEALAAAVPELLAAAAPRGPIQNSEAYLTALPAFARAGRLPAPLRCLVPFVEIVVTPDLGVQPCCAAPSAGHLLQSGLAALWHGEHFAHWRRRAVEGACVGCMLLYHEPPFGPS